MFQFAKFSTAQKVIQNKIKQDQGKNFLFGIEICNQKQNQPRPFFLNNVNFCGISC